MAFYGRKGLVWSWLQWLLAILFFILFWGTRWYTVHSYFWANKGWVTVNKVLNSPNDTWSESGFVQARTAFQQAAHAVNRASVWRGLGFVAGWQEQEDEAVAAWRRADNMPEELLRWGHLSRQNDQFEDALLWYQWAAKTAPDLAEPWYYLGLTQEMLGRFDEAETAYHQGLQRDGPHGRFYFRLGRLLTLDEATADWAASLVFFDKALASSDFDVEQELIQTHFFRGQALSQLDYQEEAIDEFKWVLERQPDDYATLIFLGFLTWRVEKDAIRAEDWFLRAVAVEHENKWAYRGLGTLYQATGRLIEAIAMYEKVLAIDTTDPLAKEQLSNLLGN